MAYAPHRQRGSAGPAAHGRARELAMDLLIAKSMLEFGTSPREALDDATEWARARGVAPLA